MGTETGRVGTHAVTGAALRLGTRASALALAQARMIQATIVANGTPCEIVTVTTEGDTSRASLAQIGGTGVFAGALRTALADGRCDLLVHSMKDLPVAAEPGLVVAAVPAREDARDAICARDGLTLAELPPGAVVGTGSPRRHAQIAEARPDLVVRDIRGNVDTRLRRVTDGDLDAVVLSAAGLARLGRQSSATELMPLDSWPTAAAQGALALEVREADAAPGTRIGDAVLALDDPDAHDAALAERQVLGLLEAGCAAPIGVSSRIGTESWLWATVHRPGGGGRIERLRAAEPAAGAGRRGLLLAAAAALAADLLSAGAAELAPLGAA